MKKIAVFFKTPGEMSYPFNKPEYWRAYHELEVQLAELGAELFIVRSQETYQGDGIFNNSWKFNDSNGIEQNGKIEVDCIYDKGEFISDGKKPVLNCDQINQICTDKWKTYSMFSSFCPKTAYTRNEAEFLSELKNIKTQKKVIKPVDQEEGKGVFIGDDEYLISCKKEYPLLLQEFLDSSVGIPGIVSGIHDLRIVVCNGEIILSFVRTPPQGSYTANVAQGGSLKVIDVSEIPNSAVNLVEDIDKKLSEFGPRLYGVDLAMTEDGFKIIEFNSRLALFENSRGKDFVFFKKKLAELLVSMCK